MTTERYEKAVSGGYCSTCGEPVTALVILSGEPAGHLRFGIPDRVDHVRPCGHSGAIWHADLAALCPEERVTRIASLLGEQP